MLADVPYRCLIFSALALDEKHRRASLSHCMTQYQDVKALVTAWESHLPFQEAEYRRSTLLLHSHKNRALLRHEGSQVPDPHVLLIVPERRNLQWTIHTASSARHTAGSSPVIVPHVQSSVKPSYTSSVYNLR